MGNNSGCPSRASHSEWANNSRHDTIMLSMPSGSSTPVSPALEPVDEGSPASMSDLRVSSSSTRFTPRTIGYPKRARPTSSSRTRLGFSPPLSPELSWPGSPASFTEARQQSDGGTVLLALQAAAAAVANQSGMTPPSRPLSPWSAASSAHPSPGPSPEPKGLTMRRRITQATPRARVLSLPTPRTVTPTVLEFAAERTTPTQRATQVPTPLVLPQGAGRVRSRRSSQTVGDILLGMENRGSSTGTVSRQVSAAEFLWGVVFACVIIFLGLG